MLDLTFTYWCELTAKDALEGQLRATLSPASLLLFFSLLNTAALWAATSLAEGSILRRSQRVPQHAGSAKTPRVL